MPRSKSRTPDQDAHAKLVLSALVGQPEGVIAAWCSVSLSLAAGPWANFLGPQSVMTARLLQLARDAQEETGALVGRA